MEDHLDVSIMEYGDLSSLVVEYPDYNSLGQVLQKIVEIKSEVTTLKARKIKETMELPKGLSSFGDLAGKALIVTAKEGDLVAYGILANELSGNFTHAHTTGAASGVAICENLQSTIQYRSFFNLEQDGGSVKFSGMLRTSQIMAENDKLILSIGGHKPQFDLDFESAYSA